MMHQPITCTNESYNEALILFFERYGFFFNSNENFTSIDRNQIDLFLDLIFYITEIYRLTASHSPLSPNDCKELLEYTTNLMLLNITCSCCHINTFPINQYIKIYSSQATDFYDDIDAEIAYKEIQAVFADQLSEYEWMYYYSPKDIIVKLHSFLEKHITNDNIEIIDFYYRNLNKNNIDFITSDKDGSSKISANEKFLHDSELEIIDISNKICNYFFSQAFSSSPISIKSVKKSNGYEHEYHLNIRNLSDAILLSLLNFDPFNQEFRQCNLPNCTNFFLTKKSSQKKMYCCRSHARTAATREYRKRQSDKN